MQRKMHKIALERTWNFWMTERYCFLIFDTHNWESKPIYLFLTVFLCNYACMHTCNLYRGFTNSWTSWLCFTIYTFMLFWISFWPHDRVQKLWFSQICKFNCISYTNNLFNLFFSTKKWKRLSVFDKSEADNIWLAPNDYYHQKADKILHPKDPSFLNLSMIKVFHRSSKSELSKNWTIVTGELKG